MLASEQQSVEAGNRDLRALPRVPQPQPHTHTHTQTAVTTQRGEGGEIRPNNLWLSEPPGRYAHVFTTWFRVRLLFITEVTTARRTVVLLLPPLISRRVGRTTNKLESSIQDVRAIKCRCYLPSVSVIPDQGSTSRIHTHSLVRSSIKGVDHTYMPTADITQTCMVKASYPGGALNVQPEGGAWRESHVRAVWRPIYVLCIYQ